MTLFFLMVAQDPTDYGLLHVAIHSQNESRASCTEAEAHIEAHDRHSHIFCVTGDELLALRRGEVM